FADAEAELYEQPETVDITGEVTGNPFNHVINGQKNTIKLTFDNKGESNYTVKLIGGVLVDKDRPNDIFRNLTSYQYSTPAPAMDHVDVKYTFYSEFPTQELGLILFVFFVDEEERQFRGVGFNETVTVVEPEQSLFDLQVLFLYLIISAIFFGIGYLIFQAFFGGVKSKKGKRRPPVSKPEDSTTGTSSSSEVKYDESWIPEHHLRPTSTRNNSRIKKKTEKVEKVENKKDD
ncbi:3471_t:CDS:2, partial [Acaulospora morrowiae]